MDQGSPVLKSSWMCSFSSLHCHHLWRGYHHLLLHWLQSPLDGLFKSILPPCNPFSTLQLEWFLNKCKLGFLPLLLRSLQWLPIASAIKSTSFTSWSPPWLGPFLPPHLQMLAFLPLCTPVTWGFCPLHEHGSLCLSAFAHSSPHHPKHLSHLLLQLPALLEQWFSNFNVYQVWYFPFLKWENDPYLSRNIMRIMYVNSWKKGKKMFLKVWSSFLSCHQEV